MSLSYPRYSRYTRADTTSSPIQLLRLYQLIFKMEPGAYNYKGIETFMGKLPPLIPVGEDPPQENTVQESGEQHPPESRWTVYSPNILRGNLDSDKPLDNDVRMSVGWNSEATARQRGSEPMPWMSTFAQQPFLFASGWDTTSDEA